MPTRYFDPPRPRLFGHRGSPATHPENTLPGFAAALEAGMPYLELDVWASREGTVVVHHDETARRTCGADHRIAELDLEQLQQLDAGHGFTPDGGCSFPLRGRGVHIPTLEEVLQTFSDARVNIEIKQESPPVEPAVLDVVRRCRREETVLLASESDIVMQRLRPLAGEIPTSASRGEAAQFFAWLQQGCPQGYRPPYRALQIPETWGDLQLVGPASIQAAHEADLEIHVWTVNEERDMERLLKLGVDGIMSDNPALLRKVAGVRV